MLQKTIKTYIESQINHHPQNQSIGIYKQEKEYAEAHGLVPEQIKLVEEQAQSRFKDAYIERVDKETEELISAESSTDFLQEKVKFLKTNQKEFVYLESDWFDIIKIDGLTLEHDDVFGTYKGLLGLKQKKAVGSSIRKWFSEKANGETTKFQLLFNDKDGLWDVNFDCDLIEGFHEELTLNTAFEMIYGFLFELVKDLESTEQ